MKVEGLNFAYANRQILNNLNFSVKKGEFLGVLGPNGCGKSTLLKNILKILKPKSGLITLENKNLNEYSLKELSKILGFVPQKSMLSMPLLVEDIILMGRYAHLTNHFSGYDKNDIKKAYEMMELLGITHFAKRIAFSLSGGEFQRVLLARALVSEPKVLLLDEPTSALDLNFAIEIMKLCEKLTKELNLLSIMVIHDLNLASMFCTRILMLKDGTIRYDDTPNKLFSPEILKEIYGLHCEVIKHGENAFVIPLKG
ncbi:MAG: ABC transporter ATP-binding protein [Campylobacter sp.]|nr:ABC transporter ATP-binding protein [Campylobacter sp.]